ncbi:MAG: hypothetical protein V4466_08890 [Pseudomonadota bacterium]
MKLLIITAALAAITATAAQAAPAPRCAADAIKRAKPLLTLHFEDDSTAVNPTISIGDEVKSLPPIKALKGTGKFDVLEVWGYIYKAEYRMRFLYAQIPDECVLMGQEVLEASDPY